MIGTGTSVDALMRERPEWQPWLAVVDQILREAQSDRCDEAVAVPAERRDPLAPLLADATITVPARLVRRVLERALRVTSAASADVDVLALLAASLRHDEAAMADVATRVGIDVEAFQSSAALLAVPLLHSCRRRLASNVTPGWVEGYCPLCASWPAFAEVLGIERSRQFRCGRCGSAWHARHLLCAYCGTVDHNDLATLVPEKAGSHASIDACKRCGGYVKTFTRLQASAPETVILDDLASVDLDMAALEIGYTRPAGPGRPFDVSVRDGGTSGLFGWRR